MIAALALLAGLVAGLFLKPTAPVWLEPYLPIAVVAALDAVFGDIVERGELKGVPVPCLRLARDVIRGLDGVRQSVGVG